MQQLAFSLYLIVLVPGGSSPAVTNAGSWLSAAECKSAAEAAFIAINKQQGQTPSISFLCVPEPADPIADTK
jgi:hypothetical protein